MKIVLDTNVFISSFFWGGNPRKIMERVIDGKDKLFICKEIIQEITSVMSGQKFNASNEYVTRFVHSIEELANYITLSGCVQNVCRDGEDDKILECAFLAGASYIVTGDNDLLVLGEFRGIKIVSAHDYLIENTER
jgi:putative PIN family toxin of toxin-antitoxin system